MNSILAATQQISEVLRLSTTILYRNNLQSHLFQKSCDDKHLKNISGFQPIRLRGYPKWMHREKSYINHPKFAFYLIVRLFLILSTSHFQPCNKILDVGNSPFRHRCIALPFKDTIASVSFKIFGLFSRFSNAIAIVKCNASFLKPLSPSWKAPIRTARSTIILHLKPRRKVFRHSFPTTSTSTQCHASGAR